jgi:uncharacterized protein (TIGR03032 family)
VVAGKKLEIGIDGDFAAALAAADATLLVSAYHAGKLLLLDLDPRERLRLTPVGYRKPMGIAVGPGQLAVATLEELHLYADNPELARYLDGASGRFERAFFPRLTWHCGPLDLHDLCFVGTELWAVNTLFSCICSFDGSASFRPRWTPRFVSALAPEDRCHLNGMALDAATPRFATALGTGDTPFGWRDDITRGGVLIRLADGEIVATQLAMPHSPRLAGASLYLLQSAQGVLSRIDPRTGAIDEVVRLDGLVRGLCIRAGIAFIGISKARAQSPTFARLEPRARVEQAAIHAVELATGRVLGSIVFRSLVEEIYDIQAIPGRAGVAVLGLYDPRHRQGVWTREQSWWKHAPPAAEDAARAPADPEQ